MQSEKSDKTLHYIYRNLRKDPSLLGELKNVSTRDEYDSFPIFIEMIQTELLKELNEEYKDEEFEEIMADVIGRANDGMDDSSLLLVTHGLTNDNNTVDINSSAVLDTPTPTNNNNLVLDAPTPTNNNNLVLDAPTPTNNIDIDNNSSNTNNNSNNINNNINEEEILDTSPESLFFCKNLNVILDPLIRYNYFYKICLDMFIHVFKKTGISHFDYLFDCSMLFNTECASIHGLIFVFAKILKNRSFDFSDFKEYFNDENCSFNSSCNNSNCDSTSATTDSSTNTSINNPKNMKKKHLGTLPNKEDYPIDKYIKIMDSIIENNPFLGYSHHDHQKDTRNTKRKYKTPVKKFTYSEFLELLKFKVIPPRPFSDSYSMRGVMKYLSLKFDREVFQIFLNGRYSSDLDLGLMIIPNLPFFFYEGADITDFISNMSRFPSEKEFSFPVNCFTLRNFLRMFEDELFLSSERKKLMAFTRSLKYFTEVYKSNSLLKIFIELMNFLPMRGTTKGVFLPDLIIFIRAYFHLKSSGLKSCDSKSSDTNLRICDLKKDNSRTSDSKTCDSKNIQVTFEPNNPQPKETLNGHSDSSCVDLSCADSSCGADNENAVRFKSNFDENSFRIPLYGRIPGPRPFPCLFDDDPTALLNGYLNGEIYKEQDRRLAEMLLDEFSETHKVSFEEIESYMEDFIIEMSNDAYGKFYILENITEIIQLIKSTSSYQSQCMPTGAQDMFTGAECVSTGTHDISTGTQCLANDGQIVSEIDASSKKLIDKILNNIKKFPERNWRYKMLFLKKIDELEKLGVGCESLKETLKNDKVFYIRKTTKIN